MTNSNCQVKELRNLVAIVLGAKIQFGHLHGECTDEDNTDFFTWPLIDAGKYFDYGSASATFFVLPVNIPSGDTECDVEVSDAELSDAETDHSSDTEAF